MTVRYNDEAHAEALDAAAWYEARQEGLVRRFLAKWKEAENRMVADPEINRPFVGDLRRCRFEVFPYALVYRIADENALDVVAVMHSSRKPGYWKSRLKG